MTLMVAATMKEMLRGLALAAPGDVCFAAIRDLYEYVIY